MRERGFDGGFTFYFRVACWRFGFLLHALPRV
jgi:hypothetical protein